MFVTRSDIQMHKARAAVYASPSVRNVYFQTFGEWPEDTLAD